MSLKMNGKIAMNMKTISSFSVRGILLVTLLTLMTLSPAPTSRVTAGAAEQDGEKPFVVEYYYKARWGYADEFIRLFKKNHYPVLKDQMRTGRITAVRAYVPTYHGDGRADWTFAVAITFKDAAAFTGPSNEDEITRRLFPDQTTFRREEQRRFEILDAHWDVPLNELDMDAR